MFYVVHGGRLRSRRKKLGLKLKDVAKAAGVSVSFISDLEHGRKRRCSVKVGHRLMNKFDEWN
jgi:transcriptional regulator with XRE-family HTH domain